MWIDCHAHLDRLSDPVLTGIVQEAEAAGVSRILSTATDIVSARAVVKQCAAFPTIFGAAGISPFDAPAANEDWETALRGILARERIVGIGEIGLDDSNPRYPSLKEQLPVFERQLALAVELDLPVILHSRGAEERIAEICRNRGVRKAMFHCYTGPRDTLRTILDNGYSVSFSGIVTFDGGVRELTTFVPLDRIFVETDCPYLAPVPHRGKPNRPAWVTITGECVAAAKQVSPERLQEAIAENFGRLFGAR